jgi:hypothetical protein
LRYDLFYNNRNQPEKTTDIARYNKILSFNRAELGYLIKAVGPEETSNILQSENTRCSQSFANLIMNEVILRNTKFVYQGVWEDIKMEAARLLITRSNMTMDLEVLSNRFAS